MARAPFAAAAAVATLLAAQRRQRKSGAGLHALLHGLPRRYRSRGSRQGSSRWPACCRCTCAPARDATTCCAFRGPRTPCSRMNGWPACSTGCARDLSGCRPESARAVHRRGGHECPSRPAGRRAGHPSRGRAGTGELRPGAGACLLITCMLMPRVLLMLDLCRRCLLGRTAQHRGRGRRPRRSAHARRPGRAQCQDLHRRQGALDRAGTRGQGRPRGVRRLRPPPCRRGSAPTPASKTSAASWCFPV